MITIVAATNRNGSKTLQMALQYQKIFDKLNIPTSLLSLEQHDVTTRSESFINLEETYLKQTKKFVFIIPEYNGSYPGILKLLIDNSDIKNSWWHKEALLVGVSDGRAGNLRGMEHLTGVLQYMRMHVYHNKLPISRINTVLDIHGNWMDDTTELVCEAQIKGFLAGE